MKSTSLEHKTVRPGLLAYSFYSSDRNPRDRNQPSVAKVSQVHVGRSLVLLLVVAVTLMIGYSGFKAVISKESNNVAPPHNVTSSHNTIHSQATAVAPAINYCGGNSILSFVRVSISQRHLWACRGTNLLYDSPVVTGMENLAADKTPTGTYHIYAKITNTTLTGVDSTGRWSDPVSYWMPFLDNQYGTYGFHDATWRPDSAFGHIDPYSPQASHGCIELPLAASKWLYNWGSVGTTLTIES